MKLRVVGAGLGRTGTMSLKLALERLLGAPCHHMLEVFKHMEQVPIWHAAALGNMPDWDQLFQEYAAAVDWPSSAFWPELMEAYPDALVVLSTRDTEAWWQSAHETIFNVTRNAPPDLDWFAMVQALFTSRFTMDLGNAEACKAAFDQHNAKVRATVPPHRLLEWRASDGWKPLCTALGLPIPDEPFPRVNTREEWAARNSPVHSEVDMPAAKAE
ncbi:MAG TPA: sulfotransferase [Chthonomonadaceae bacterium]|nr:sulfotransferase [Chthonomonadaceae bacterium]